MVVIIVVQSGWSDYRFLASSFSETKDIWGGIPDTFSSLLKDYDLFGFQHLLLKALQCSLLSLELVSK